MKQLLTALLILAAISATGQTKTDSTRIERLMYHYAILHKAAYDSLIAHKNNPLLEAKFMLLQRRYSDSLNKYLDLRDKELDKQLNELLNRKMKDSLD